MSAEPVRRGTLRNVVCTEGTGGGESAEDNRMLFLHMHIPHTQGRKVGSGVATNNTSAHAHFYDFFFFIFFRVRSSTADYDDFELMLLLLLPPSEGASYSTPDCSGHSLSLYPSHSLFVV